MTIVLHDYWRSSAAYRVRIALNLKSVTYESRPVDLVKGEQRAPDYRVLSPQGLIPALEIDGAVLTQSLAIMDYLDACFSEPRLIPAEPLARARVLAQALVIAADIHPIDNLRVLQRLESQFGADQAAKDAWYTHWIVEGLTALEAMVEGDGPFLGGAAPNVADVCLVPQLANARRFAVPLEAFPRLLRADAAASALPAFAAVTPEQVRASAA